MSGSGDPPSADEVAALLGRFAPFEPEPLLAVAVSGGADSTAAVLLLDDWARRRGGRAVALIVDHGLRPESAAEARAAGERLGTRGLEWHVLTWDGPKPEANRQAAARSARYRLLADWCASRAVLHLALAHHREDQAETLLLRLGRGSGLDGLAAMPGIRELAGVRLLRPFLAVPRSRLEAALRMRGVGWSEDPSNRDEGFARVRLRRLAPRLAAEGLTAGRLAMAAGHLGRARAALEDEVARLLAGAVEPDPAGFAWIVPERLLAAPQEIGRRALARVLTVFGGSAFAPRRERLQQLFARLREGPLRGATLAGCRIVTRRGRLLVAREGAAAPSLAVRPGQSLRWDGRFDIALSGRRAAGTPGLVLGPLGQEGWREISGAVAKAAAAPIPPVARLALPALRDQSGILAAPHLGYQRAGPARASIQAYRFAPELTLTSGPFTVA